MRGGAASRGQVCPLQRGGDPVALNAWRLLGSARWDARSVAVHLGFTDAANLGRFFRDRTGLTPAAFAARDTTTHP